jgi:hypothetical protein
MSEDLQQLFVLRLLELMRDMKALRGLHVV